MQGEIDIKRFKKLKRISKGGFGFVYQIEELKTGELYAAKIIDCDDDDERCNEMVNREVSIMIHTNHPTIIKFIGYSKVDFQNENNVTIIMELAKNGSLREVLRKIQQGDGPKNYTNTSRQIILIGVARGMKYLHDRNIIHRDIKPENILLDENFQPHITDFGLSKFYEVGHSHSQTKFGGTLPYEAPEILKNMKYDRKVDVYSFSILMFEVLTDSVPYPELENGAMSDYDFMNKIINKGFRPKFEIPVKDSLKELIEQCWSENPDERPTFDEIFNKLANKTDEGEDFILEDVDIDEMNLYVEDVTEVTDSTEKLLSKISELEEDNKQLKSENAKLKTENKKQSDTIKTLEEDNKQFKSENAKLKTENKKQSDTIKTLEEEIRQLKSENAKLITENKKQSDTIKTLEEDNKQLKNETKKLKSEKRKQSDTSKVLEEDNRQIKSENTKLKSENKKQSDTSKVLEEDNRQIKSENTKLKSENKKQSDTSNDIKERKHERSKSKQKRVKHDTEKSESTPKKTKNKAKQQGTTATIIVSGYNQFNQLGEKPNNKTLKYEFPIISPPLNSSLDSSLLLSYSVYDNHCVLVTRSGSLLGIGDNSYGRIIGYLEKTMISQFTEFSIKDKSGKQLVPISAVCGGCNTLYMLSKSSGRGRQLVYCDIGIKEGDPLFLDIGDEEPVSLFSGYYQSAAISEKGEIIFIIREAVTESPNSRIKAVPLPDGEKASSVACLESYFVVLSTNGRVFSYLFKSSNEFILSKELKRYEIIQLSGTLHHCLAVSKDGYVFGDGLNSKGQLAQDKEKYSISFFTRISLLSGNYIRAAYAGGCHSLFETVGGKILSCGYNICGQLLLGSGPSEEDAFSPKETTITEGATFCIAGNGISAVFVGGDPPPNTPNMQIRH